MKFYHVYFLVILLVSVISLTYIEKKLDTNQKDMHYVVAYFIHVICSYLIWFLSNFPESDEEQEFSNYMMLAVIIMYTRLSFIVIFS
jgi:hypothetical protein